MNDDLVTVLQELDPIDEPDRHELHPETARARRIHDRALGAVDTPRGPAPRRGRRRRVGLTAAAVVLAVGVLGAFWSPWPSDGPFDCRGFGSIDQLVATEQLADGTTYELWTTQPSVDAPVNGELLIEKAPDGSTEGWGLGCSPPDQVPALTDPLADVSWGGSLTVDTRTGTAEAYGPVPEGAVRVEVTFEDGEVVDAEVGSGNYWLVVRELAQVECDDDCDNWDPPQPVAVVAQDADGEIIDRHSVPMDYPSQAESAIPAEG